MEPPYGAVLFFQRQDTEPNMCAKAKNADRFREVRNAKAHRDYFVEETLEAGIVLTGAEVKAIREGGAQISDAFARPDGNHVVLYHANIAEYSHSAHVKHNPYRPRKLLLHRREILRLKHELDTGGRSIIPLRLYFKKALVKVELGLCKGKKMHDKRDDIKEKEAKREMDRYSRVK